ncbi:hypothetical protein AB0N06_23015 [Streptomyces sp. NPDC051020]|uniref:hypothetical protein n=1 Tax=Streptomyces sp. NPDC051020 TaxID=3155409 RepID=UPI003433151C
MIVLSANGCTDVPQGRFTTLNELRAGQDDMRGAVSETHRDQARAAIVFTAAGIDACLRTLLRDSLPILLSTTGEAHGAFVSHFMSNRLTGDLTSTLLPNSVRR